MSARLVLSAALGLAGCYAPAFTSPGFYCHAADNPACPDGQHCDATTSRCEDGPGVASSDAAQLPVGDGMVPADLASGGGNDLSVDQGVDHGASDFSSGGCKLHINEVQTAGGGGAQDEFIELFNACASATDLTGDKLVYRSGAGTTDIDLVTFASVSVPASGYLVVGQTNYAGSATVHYTASGMASAGGGVALLGSGGAVVDSLGYGTATNAYVKTAAASAPASAQSIGRKPDGKDSGDNSQDFVVLTTPTPGATNN